MTLTNLCMFSANLSIIGGNLYKTELSIGINTKE